VSQGGAALEMFVQILVAEKLHKFDEKITYICSSIGRIKNSMESNMKGLANHVPNPKNGIIMKQTRNKGTE